jgi:hypothetical protein
MPQPSSALELDILGEKLVVRASEDPDLVNEVAELVKLRLQESKRRLQQKEAMPARNNVLLLALLDLAEEYVKSKRRSLVHRSKIGSKLVEIRAMLDRAEGRS